jgi:membrane dipeptidase
MKKIAFATVCTCLTLFLSAQSYQKIHKDATVIDTHNDFISTSIEKKVSFDQSLKGTTHSDLKRMKEGGLDIQIFSIFCDENYGKGTAFAFANREMDSMYAIIQRNPTNTMLVKSPNDLATAVKKGMLGCMMGVEGGHMMEDRLDYLDSLYKRGARYMTLTWNNSTDWASSAADERAKNNLGHPYGLNAFGEKVVERMLVKKLFMMQCAFQKNLSSLHTAVLIVFVPFQEI